MVGKVSFCVNRNYFLPPFTYFSPFYLTPGPIFTLLK